ALVRSDHPEQRHDLCARRCDDDFGAAVVFDCKTVSLDLADFVFAGLVWSLSYSSVSHAAFWNKVPSAVSFAGPAHRLRKNMDFNCLECAIGFWCCSS